MAFEVEEAEERRFLELQTRRVITDTIARCTPSPILPLTVKEQEERTEVQWLLLGAALASRELATKVLALPDTVWHPQLKRFITALRNGRDWMVDRLSTLGVKVEPEQKAIEAVLTYLAALAERRAIEDVSYRLGTAAKLMRPAEWREFAVQELAKQGVKSELPVTPGRPVDHPANAAG